MLHRSQAARRAVACALALAALVASLIASESSVADSTVMRGSKAPAQFKIDDSALSDDEKRCLRYALKQWVMYDKAKAEGKVPNSTAQKNRNETSTGVMDPGPQHNLRNAATLDPAKKHHLSSRCMSEGEVAKMEAVYGPTSPFHAPGQEVQDPVTNPGAWFASPPTPATMKVQVVDQVPGQKKTVAGEMKYALVPPQAAGVPEMKGGPAFLYIRRDPGKTKDAAVQRTWCYPSDTDGDGWITNMDAKCPENQLDFYQIIKHELGHWFCFWHKGADFTIPIQYNNPDAITGIESPGDEEACCPHCGGEFATAAATQLYFSSTRPGGLGGKDIWLARWDEVTLSYVDPVNLGPGVNSPFDEITPEAAAADAWIYFASNRPGGAGGFDLYVAPNVDTLSWGPPAFLAPVNTPADETSPMEWSDRLLFSSNRPGGVGSWDLYQAMKSNAPSYLDPPTNLGPGINTPAADKDPMIAEWDGADGLLYFASNRPGGLGAYDIYRAFLAAGAWGAAANLGPGVNSSFNETAPHIPPSHDRIFYATDRRAAMGAGWELFESLNLAPRVSCMAGHDVEGAPGDTLATPIMVMNDGALPLMVTPSATHSAGWTLLYSAAPLDVMPGDAATWIVSVVVPETAALGDTTQVDVVTTAGPVSDACGALVIVEATSTGAGAIARAHVTLEQNIPNPLNPTTSIAFWLPRADVVALDVFDAAGRHVVKLASGRRAAGAHEVRWDGRDARGEAVVSGVYFYRLRTSEESITRKLVLLK